MTGLVTGIRYFDLAIVGGGAVGAAAAVQAAAAGLAVVVLDRTTPGGDARALRRIETVPGHPIGLTGEEYMIRTVAQAERFGAILESGSDVIAVEAAGKDWWVRLLNGPQIRVRAVVLATGADRDLPPIDGLQEFRGAGVYTVLPQALPETLRGASVFVWGDPLRSASAALALSRHCGAVTLVTSGGRISTGVPKALLEGLRATLNVTARVHTFVEGVVGVDHVEVVILRNVRTDRTTVREAGALFVLVPGRPRSECLAGASRNVDGAILTGEAAIEGGDWSLSRRPFDLETSLPGVFAAGEVRADGGQGRQGVIEGMAAVRQVLSYLGMLMPVEGP